MRWIFLFGFTVHIFAHSFDQMVPSTPEEILSLSSPLLIEGYVSAATGQLVLSETDFHIKAAQDLLLKRTYIPPQILGRYEDQDQLNRLILGKALLQLKTKGWVIYPHLWAGYNFNSPYFQLRDPNGITLAFEIQGTKGILKTARYGCSNFQGESVCSSNDIRNIELKIEGNLAKAVWPDGTERFYRKQNSRTYRLEKELLPNGKAIQYTYNLQGLFTASSCDPTGKWIYASITQKKNHKYLASNGQTASLTYEVKEIRADLKKKNGRGKANFRFSLMTKASHPFYINHAEYDESLLLAFYDKKDYPISCKYFRTKDTPALIQTFSTPSGSLSFSYDFAIAGQKKGSTMVTYPNGAVAIYRFNQLLLLETIENWLEEKLIFQKTFEYDDKQHIQQIKIYDEDGLLFITKSFVCDCSGNPVLEKTEGDFGSFTIRREFDKNRLIFEELDNGLQTKWTYLENTWLPTSKTTYHSDKKIGKTTYSYDEANNLILLEEEGQAKTRYHLYESAPHLHRIEWEEQTDWEDRLTGKIHYTYDLWGNIAKEERFESDGKISSAIDRIYNEKGELLKETNSLQGIRCYEYDARGRCIHEESENLELNIYRFFDEKGRLIFLKENGFETQFVYNVLDELIEKTDHLGNKVKYHYHPIHRKPDLIESPPFLTKIIYDFLGRKLEEIDLHAPVTKKEYSEDDLQTETNQSENFGALQQTLIDSKIKKPKETQTSEFSQDVLDFLTSEEEHYEKIEKANHLLEIVQKKFHRWSSKNPIDLY